MIRVFPKSKSLARVGAITAVSASALYAFFLYARGRAETMIVSAAVLLVFLLLAFRIAALFVAESENLKRLSVLYNDMDPQVFIADYEPLLGAEGLSRLDRLTVTSHLANAYAFSGDFKKAVAFLKECPIPDRGRRRFNAAALVAGNLCSCFLLARDANGAERALAELDGIIAEAIKNRTPVNARFLRNRRVQAANLKLLKGKKIDAAALRTELQGSSNRLYRARLRLLIAEACLAEKDAEAALEQLDLIDGAGGNTILAQRAREIRASIAQQ